MNFIPFAHNLNASKCIAIIILKVINGCFKYDLIKLSENALMTGEKFSIENTSLEYYSHLFH